MKRNGTPRKNRRELHQDILFEHSARASSVPTRSSFFTWIRRWKDHPERVFWEIGPTGERKQL